MYRNNLRVFTSPPWTPQGFSPHGPHPHLIVVETFGEGRAGCSISCGNTALNKESVLRQKIGEGGLSN